MYYLKHDVSNGDMSTQAVVTCLAYDALRVYSGSADQTIMVWDTTSLSRVMVLEGHDGSIVSLAIQGQYLYSASADATMRMWDKLTGRLIRLIAGHRCEKLIFLLLLNNDV